MKIRIIAGIAFAVASLLPLTSFAGPRVQVIIGSPGGCAPIVYNRPICGYPTFVPYYRPSPVFFYQPPVTYISPGGTFISSRSLIVSPAPQRGVYRAPIVPVNNIRNGPGFTWRR
jgi:hypothetical protein